MQYYIEELFGNYAAFNGRTDCKRFWYYALFNVLVAMALALAALVINRTLFGTNANVLLYPAALYVLATLLPSLAITVRRLHDVGMSGWWILLALVPVVGGLSLLAFLVGDSESGPNKYGPKP